MGKVYYETTRFIKHSGVDYGTVRGWIRKGRIGEYTCRGTESSKKDPEFLMTYISEEELLNLVNSKGFRKELKEKTLKFIDEQKAIRRRYKELYELVGPIEKWLNPLIRERDEIYFDYMRYTITQESE